MVLDSHCDFFIYYREIFIPVYSDLTTQSLVKPHEILEGIENCFSYLTRYYDLSEDLVTRNLYLSQSFNLLENVTFNCYKTLWFIYFKKFEAILENPELKNFCLNNEQNKFDLKFESSLTFLNKSRGLEKSNNINNPEIIDNYIQAIKLIKESCSMIDQIKIKDFQELESNSKHKFDIITIIIEIGVPIIGGIVLILFLKTYLHDYLVSVINWFLFNFNSISHLYNESIT